MSQATAAGARMCQGTFFALDANGEPNSVCALDIDVRINEKTIYSILIIRILANQPNIRTVTIVFVF